MAFLSHPGLPRTLEIERLILGHQILLCYVGIFLHGHADAHGKSSSIQKSQGKQSCGIEVEYST